MRPLPPVAPTYEATSETHPDGILVFSQPGALPPASLEQLITAVRGLDMDDVRRQVEARVEGQQEDRQGTQDTA